MPLFSEATAHRFTASMFCIGKADEEAVGPQRKRQDIALWEGRGLEPKPCASGETAEHLGTWRNSVMQRPCRGDRRRADEWALRPQSTAEEHERSCGRTRHGRPLSFDLSFRYEKY